MRPRGMASNKLPRRSSTSPREKCRNSTDDTNGSDENSSPPDELRQMTDESSNLTTDVSYDSTQSIDVSWDSAETYETLYSSSFSPKEKSPKGLRITDLKRRSIKQIDQHQTVSPKAVTPQKEMMPQWWMIISIVSLCIAMVYFIVCGRENPQMKYHSVHQLEGRELMVANFMKGLKLMKSDFPAQSKNLWAVMAASSKSVLKTEMPSQPGVMLLVSSKQGKGTVRCLIRKIGDVLKKVYNDSGVTVFSMDEHLQLDGNSLKLAIDEKFQIGLGIRKEHVAVLHNLEKVSGHAAMMFHAYCDNLSAPFKDAIIIFTMELSLSEDRLTSMDEYDVAGLVESDLEDLWKGDIGYDNVMALKSRVANHVGVVKAEDSATSSC